MFTSFDDDKAECEVNGIRFVATIHVDEDYGPPWKENDGHGPVSDWEHRDKRAGELILNEDRGSKRFYDYQEACRIALKDGWGTEGGPLEGESKRAYAARAAMADYERLRRWCNDDWRYVGVSVQAFLDTDDGETIELTDEYCHACWGIESDAGEYLIEIANEELDSCMDEALDALADMGLPALPDCVTE